MLSFVYILIGLSNTVALSNLYHVLILLTRIFNVQ